MNTKSTIIIAVIALAIGFALGSSYQNNDPSENVQKINAMYSMVYISDIEGESIGINIISMDRPHRKHFKSNVLLNKYDVLEYTDDDNDRILSFSFEGYDLEGKPIIGIVKDFQEESDYKKEIWNLTGYYPIKITRSS